MQPKVPMRSHRLLAIQRPPVQPGAAVGGRGQVLRGQSDGTRILHKENSPTCTRVPIPKVHLPFSPIEAVTRSPNALRIFPYGTLLTTPTPCAGESNDLPARTIPTDAHQRSGLASIPQQIPDALADPSGHRLHPGRSNAAFTGPRGDTARQNPHNGAGQQRHPGRLAPHRPAQTPLTALLPTREGLSTPPRCPAGRRPTAAGRGGAGAAEHAQKGPAPDGGCSARFFSRRSGPR